MEGNGAYDPEARVARLSERVENQGARISSLETTVNRGFSEIQASFGKQLNELSTELRSRSQTPWGIIWSAMGVCFAILFGIGGALYMPVRETTNEIKADIRLLETQALSVAAFQDFRATYENNRLVSRNEYIDKFAQMNAAIAEVRSNQVPRKELERTWQLYDQAIAFINVQLGELKRENASVYTPRDKILEQEDKLRRMEELIRAMQVNRPGTPQ